MKPPESILYLNMIPGDLVQERLLAGIRRYAWGRGWEVEAVREAASRPRLIPERHGLTTSPLIRS